MDAVRWSLEGMGEKFEGPWQSGSRGNSKDRRAVTLQGAQHHWPLPARSRLPDVPQRPQAVQRAGAKCLNMGAILHSNYYRVWINKLMLNVRHYCQFKLFSLLLSFESWSSPFFCPAAYALDTMLIFRWKWQKGLQWSEILLSCLEPRLHCCGERKWFTFYLSTWVTLTLFPSFAGKKIQMDVSTWCLQLRK